MTELNDCPYNTTHRKHEKEGSKSGATHANAALPADKPQA